MTTLIIVIASLWSSNLTPCFDDLGVKVVGAYLALLEWAIFSGAAVVFSIVGRIVADTLNTGKPGVLADIGVVGETSLGDVCR
jgi:hypothetical protein